MDKVTSRSVIAGYQLALSQSTGIDWLDLVSNYFPSDQAIEEYPWLGMPPAFREWLGKRKVHKFREDFISIRNLKFESTIEIEIDDHRRDRYGMIEDRIAEHVERGDSHFASLVSTLILNGATGTAYDGQYFFDTDHETGSSGAQSNKISVDISALPTEVHGSITNPSPEEAAQAVFEGINAIAGFVDDQGEPMNETASEFLVMAPLSLAHKISSGLNLPLQASSTSTNMDKMVKVVGNTRLAAWTDRFVVFRTDTRIKAIIRQEESAIEVSSKAEGSDFAHDNDAYEYGLKSNRNVGYGRWECCVMVILI